MTLLRIFVLTGSFLTVTCLVAALHQALFSSRKVVADRLSEHTGVDNSRKDSFEKTMKEEAYRFLGEIGRFISGRAYLKRLQSKLTRARILVRPEELAGFSFVCGLAALLICWLATGSFPAAAISGIIGFKLPDVMVNLRRHKRLFALNQQLPDALDIIANGLRAGFSFTQALSVVVQEMESPISEEFGRVIRKNQLGMPMADVLQELSENSDSDDLRIMVTAILIQRQVGGNLAEILSNVSHTVRERVRIKGEIKTLTAQGRITAMVISLLPPGVMVMILIMNPGYMMLMFTETLGLTMLATAVSLQLLGIVVLRKIINIEV